MDVSRFYDALEVRSVQGLLDLKTPIAAELILMVKIICQGEYRHILDTKWRDVRTFSGQAQWQRQRTVHSQRVSGLGDNESDKNQLI